MLLTDVRRGQRIRLKGGTRIYDVVWTWWGEWDYRKIELFDRERHRMKYVRTHKWRGGPSRECVLIEESAKEELHAV
jgi:hypothetical protein